MAVPIADVAGTSEEDEGGGVDGEDWDDKTLLKTLEMVLLVLVLVLVLELVTVDVELELHDVENKVKVG